MKKILKNIWILSIFLLWGCSPQKILVEDKVIEKTIIKDSIIVKDSIVFIPQEKVVEVVPQLDTLKMEIETAKAVAYLDTSKKILRGKLESKKTTQKEIVEVTKIIEKTDTVYLEKPQPYPKPVKYVPKIYKWSMGFSIIVLLAVFGTIIWKLKRWFI